jgi:exonuclease III
VAAERKGYSGVGLYSRRAPDAMETSLGEGWSQRVGVRERNVGWRIDYVLASAAAMRYVQQAFIRPEVRGSDHCPVGVELDPAVVG